MLFNNKQLGSNLWSQGGSWFVMILYFWHHPTVCVYKHYQQYKVLRHYSFCFYLMCNCVNTVYKNNAFNKCDSAIKVYRKKVEAFNVQFWQLVYKIPFFTLINGPFFGTRNQHTTRFTPTFWEHEIASVCMYILMRTPFEYHHHLQCLIFLRAPAAAVVTTSSRNRNACEFTCKITPCQVVCSP